MFRLAEPDWGDPLDVSYSRANGGRWNVAGRFGALYLNATLRMARLQVDHRLAGFPYGVEDLDPSEQHDLVEVDVAEADFLDCVTDEGLGAVALPATYPDDETGVRIPHDVCAAIAADAYDGGLSGVSCRSAARDATPDDHELAVFEGDASVLVVEMDRRPFGDWYLSA
jgi:hypothetical protein